MSRQLDTLARIGLAGAIVDTYQSGMISGTKAMDIRIQALLDELKITTEYAFGLYDRVTSSGQYRQAFINSDLY